MTIWEYFVYLDNNNHIQTKKGIMTCIWDSETLRAQLSWLTEDNSALLDKMFIFEHSGSKRLSPYFKRMLFASEHTLDTPNPVELIAPQAVEKYADKWNKIYSALVDSSYNPLENYDMEEVETPDITKERDTTTKTKLTTTSSGSSSEDVFGFNSGVGVPSSENEVGSETTVEGSDDDNATHEEETETGTRELTRHGNIGVTTSQQMLTSEIELREHYNFCEIVLNDIAKLLCLNVY